MTAKEVKDALRKRHSAVSQGYGVPPILDAWTVIEEWEEIDLLAFSAHRHPQGARSRKSDYPRVGYEVKVSRSDFRRELLRPGKRLKARNMCHEFYFATPKGLLTDEEKAFVQPEEWGWSAFQRQPCSGEDTCFPAKHVVYNYKERGFKGTTRIVPDALEGWVVCPHCQGKGYSEVSQAEQEAPTLWIPPDTGLIEVDENRSVVVRPSPVRTPLPLTDQQVHDLIRWISVRPDPRHYGVAEAQRAFAKRNRR